MRDCSIRKESPSDNEKKEVLYHRIEIIQFIAMFRNFDESFKYFVLFLLFCKNNLRSDPITHLMLEISLPLYLVKSINETCDYWSFIRSIILLPFLFQKLHWLNFRKYRKLVNRKSLRSFQRREIHNTSKL